MYQNSDQDLATFHPALNTGYNPSIVGSIANYQALANQTPGAHFTDDISSIIQIKLETIFCSISFTGNQITTKFAHAMTAELSWHVQNFVVITVSKFAWEQNKICIKFKLCVKNL